MLKPIMLPADGQFPSNHDFVLYSNETDEPLLYDGDDDYSSGHSGPGLILVLCVLYSVLFCFGFAGNLWVISVVVYILKTFRKQTQNANIFMYILSLAIVDSLVLLNVPMLVSDIFFGHWMFGYYLCKIYWIIESVNKVLSKLIIAAMSLDRFLSICRVRSDYYVRSCQGTAIIIAALAAIVCFSMYPVYVNTEEVVFNDIYEYANENDTLPEIHKVQTKCVLQMKDFTMKTFAVYLLVIGFCVPSVLIATFYSCILQTVHKHAKAFGCHRSQIPLKRVTFATFMLMLFYFVCWMPFWITTVYAAFSDKEALTVTQVYVLYFSHLLVYVNSAFNWVLYASMNKNLKETKMLASQKNASSSRLLPLNDRKFYDVQHTTSSVHRNGTSFV